MLELAGLLAGSFYLALSGALMPGPLLTVTVADSARRGFITGPLLILGHAILELSLIVAIIYGLGPFLKMHLVMGIIALLGGAILFWMGIGMIRSAAGLTLDTSQMEGGTSRNPVLSGILASVSNPYWILWWATIGLGYLVAAMRHGAIGVALFFVGHISADLLWYSAIALGVSRGRKIVNDSVYQWAIRVCGSALIVFGGWFLFTSVSYFRKH